MASQATSGGDALRDGLQDGKQNVLKGAGGAFIARELRGAVRRIVIAGDLQNGAIAKLHEFQAARIRFRLLGRLDTDVTAQIERKGKVQFGDGLIEAFELRENTAVPALSGPDPEFHWG